MRGTDCGFPTGITCAAGLPACCAGPWWREVCWGETGGGVHHPQLLQQRQRRWRAPLLLPCWLLSCAAWPG